MSDTPSDNSWFETGQSAVDRALLKNKTFTVGQRFFIKPGAEAMIAFLDGDNTQEEPIGNFKEHQYETLDGKWPNYCTCVGGGRGCEFCLKGIKAYEAWPFSIIQIKPVWKDKEGKEHGNQKKLLIAKKEVMQRMLRHIQTRKGLVGTIWTCFRTNSNKSYTVGDDWQFERKIEGGRAELAKHLGVDMERVTPFNYRELLKPKTTKELLDEGADFAGTKKRQDSWGSKGDGGGGDGGGASRSASVDYRA